MANWDNLSTQIEQEGQRTKFDEGMIEGYSAPVNPLPAVAYKTLKDMTARDRGYAYGWLIRMDELLGER